MLNEKLHITYLLSKQNFSIRWKGEEIVSARPLETSGSQRILKRQGLVRLVIRKYIGTYFINIQKDGDDANCSFL